MQAVESAAPPAPAETSRLLLASEVAELLQVTSAWVYAETRAGRLPHIRLGRYVRYRGVAIHAWIKDLETDAPSWRTRRR